MRQMIVENIQDKLKMPPRLQMQLWLLQQLMAIKLRFHRFANGRQTDGIYCL
jgi:hypothetical protein